MLLTDFSLKSRTDCIPRHSLNYGRFKSETFFPKNNVNIVLPKGLFSLTLHLPYTRVSWGGVVGGQHISKHPLQKGGQLPLKQLDMLISYFFLNLFHTFKKPFL